MAFRIGPYQPTGRVPATLPVMNGLTVWLDASDLSTLFQDTAGSVPVTATSQNVGKWLDKSGNANHGTGSPTKPIYTAGFKGNGVRSLGGTSYTSTAGGSTTGGNSRTYFFVCSDYSTASGGPWYYILAQGTSCPGWGLTGYSAGNLKWGLAYCGGGIGDHWGPTNATSGTTPYIFCMHYDGVTGTLFINNVADTGGGGTMTNVSTTIEIGRGTFGESASITAYELVVYNRAVTSAERTQISDYLNAKWAIY